MAFVTPSNSTLDPQLVSLLSSLNSDFIYSSKWSHKYTDSFDSIPNGLSTYFAASSSCYDKFMLIFLKNYGEGKKFIPSLLKGTHVWLDSNFISHTGIWLGIWNHISTGIDYMLGTFIVETPHQISLQGPQDKTIPSTSNLIGRSFNIVGIVFNQDNY